MRDGVPVALNYPQTLELMQISHENESEHDIDIEVVGIGLTNEDWDFREIETGAGPNLAHPSKARADFAPSPHALRSPLRILV